MLRMPQQYTGDEKANEIIAKYLNGNILDLVNDKLEEYEDIQEKEAEEDDPDFWESVSEFFPYNYPESNMGKVFLGLKALLESEYEFVPELAMEYVMYRLIQNRIHIADDIGMITQEPLQAERDYVIRILKEEYPDKEDLAEGEEEDEDGFFSWKEELERLEDLHYYEEVYFWDTDYLCLDYFTEEGLRNSAVSEFLGISNIGDRSRRFEVPPQWLE